MSLFEFVTVMMFSGGKRANILAPSVVLGMLMLIMLKRFVG
ncbi:hypothetical protein [Dokdonella sp.]